MSQRSDSIQMRILTKGIRAEDIKHPGRLTDEQIRSIDVTTAYMWLISKDWKKRDFQKWLDTRYEEKIGE